MKKILFFLSWVCLLSAIGVIAQSKDDQRNPLYTLSANQSDLQIQELKRVPSQPVRHDSPEGYPRNIVLEEATGTWCGYCPSGIVMCEYVHEKYGDRIFPIAVHQGDRMEVPEYQDFINEFAKGFPSVIANRTKYFHPTELHIIDKIYTDLIENPTYAKINLTCNIERDKLNIISETEFAYDTDINHQLSFVIVEDGVGPYIQTNFYTQGDGMGKWDNAGSKALITFDDVARHIDTYPYIPNSLPSIIEGGKKYTTKRTIPLTRVKSNHFRLIGLIINCSTGEIVNASQTEVFPTGDITLNHIAVTLHPGETISLSATINTENIKNNDITWHSLDDEIAVVDNDGLVSGVNIGETIVSAIVKDKSASCAVNVIDYSIGDISEKNGLRFKITGDLTCEVTQPEIEGGYNNNHIIIPDNVEFYNKTYSVTSIGASAFSGCANLKSTHISSSITEIGNFAFDDCRKLECVEIPNSVKKIGSFAFQSCHELAFIEIPTSVESIMGYAFNYCTQLKEIKIPNSVKEIGINAFHGCQLENIYCDTKIPPIWEKTVETLLGLMEYEDEFERYETCTLYVPKESIDTYRTAPVWENFKNIRAIDSTDGIDEIIDEESTCDAFSLTGILVAQGKTVAELRNELPAGVYVLRFANSKTSKIIIR